MARSDSEQEGTPAPRLPSVEPEKVRSAQRENKQFADANEYFSSLDPEMLAFPVLEVSAATTVNGLGQDQVSPANDGPNESSLPEIVDDLEIVAEIDAPQEQLWDEAMAATLGSELQQAIPKPAVRKAKALQVAKRAIPMARRTSNPGIEIFEREDEPFEWRELLTLKGVMRNSSFLVSLLLHSLLLLFLSLLVVKSGIGDSTLFLDATSAPAAPDEVMLEAFDINPVMFENDKVLEDSPLSELVEEALEDEASSMDALKTEDDLHKNQPQFGSLQGNQRAQSDGKSATFFGTKASGRRFVFVVDRSTSMEYGSQNFVSRELFDRYDVAKSELMNAIDSLQPHQEFFVLMFAHNTMAMFQNKPVDRDQRDFDFEMISATNNNKVRFQAWLDKTRMGPGTDPRLALEIAIDMKPDAIFMLSDGAFVSERMDNRPKTRDIINRHSSAGTIVPINTISLVVEGTIPVMEGIANKSGGLFRFTTIKDYVKQVAILRGPMRSRALEQLLEIENYSWEAREEVISHILLPMLHESSLVERISGEALLHRATMGLFKRHVDKVTEPGSEAAQQWFQIIQEIDGYYRTSQVTALGQGRELEEKLLLAVLELEDDSLYELFESLDPDSLSSITMIEMVRAIEQAHLEFGTSPKSIGWLRYLSARLSGKKPKERSELGRLGWSVEQAQVSIDRLFESRAKRAQGMFQKFKDSSKSLNFRKRMGNSIVSKYPETKEAGRVRLELEKQRRLTETPVSLPDDESEEPENPYAQVQ